MRGVRGVIRVEPDNTASVGVARSCGFSHVGDVRHHGVTMQVHVLDL